MYRIISKNRLADNLVDVWVEAPLIAKKGLPGQFIILRATEDGERVPFTLAECDPGRGAIRLIFQEIGATTLQMGAMEPGDAFADVLGPLGTASHLPESGRVLCVGGGVGTAVVYPQIKWMHARGVTVDVIEGARSRDYVILEDEIKQNCTNLYVTTDDGSYGFNGRVTDMMQKLWDEGVRWDEVIAIGPLIMMKFVCLLTKKWGVKTMVSMNPIMVDGTGMCGGCRLSVGGETKYACVDGPDFDGHQVDFDEAMRRQGMYKGDEAEQKDHVCRRLQVNG